MPQSSGAVQLRLAVFSCPASDRTAGGITTRKEKRKVKRRHTLCCKDTPYHSGSINPLTSINQNSAAPQSWEENWETQCSSPHLTPESKPEALWLRRKRKAGAKS